MKTLLAAAALAASATPLAASPYRTPVPATFASRGADRKAIETILANYTRAVSTKDRALFESQLLSKDIPFSGVPLPLVAGSPLPAANYAGFAKAVFAGAPFTQRFQDIHIDQDGPLASVSLVFVNTTSTEQSWGWKTMQLVKVDGRWKIAAEFYTGHD